MRERWESVEDADDQADGGTPPCYLDRVCDACGRLVESGEVCPACGAPLEPSA